MILVEEVAVPIMMPEMKTKPKRSMVKRSMMMVMLLMKTMKMNEDDVLLMKMKMKMLLLMKMNEDEDEDNQDDDEEEENIYGRRSVIDGRACLVILLVGRSSSVASL